MKLLLTGLLEILLYFQKGGRPFVKCWAPPLAVGILHYKKLNLAEIRGRASPGGEGAPGGFLGPPKSVKRTIVRA